MMCNILLRKYESSRFRQFIERYKSQELCGKRIYYIYIRVIYFLLHQYKCYMDTTHVYIQERPTSRKLVNHRNACLFNRFQISNKLNSRFKIRCYFYHYSKIFCEIGKHFDVLQPVMAKFIQNQNLVGDKWSQTLISRSVCRELSRIVASHVKARIGLLKTRSIGNTGNNSTLVSQLTNVINSTLY